MKNSDYWKNRFEQLEKSRHERAKSDLAEIEKIFDENIIILNQKIELWYKRIAENNGVSMAEARKMLSKNQLKEFKWDVYQYIEKAQSGGDWNKELENASAKVHISRLEALKIESRAAIEELYAQYGKAVRSDVSSVYSNTRLRTNYEIAKGLNVAFNSAKIDRAALEAVLSKPWAADGFNFSERIWNDKEKLIKELHKELTLDIVQGRSPQKAIDAIAKKMNTSKSNAGRLVMTEEAYFSSAAKKDEYEYLGVERYQILATLDDRTSEICQGLDSKVFEMKDYEPGTTAPPFHVRCRSDTIPYFDDNYTADSKRIARDPETGENYYVPADITYPEWKEKYVDKGLTDVGNGGIIKESNKKSITPITDNSVERVPKIKIQGYSDEQCKMIQQQHKELLKYSRDNNENMEVAFVLDHELKNRKEFKGSDDRLDFGGALYGKDLFVMHNHPRNSSYSDTDIAFILLNDNVKSLSIIKNNGNVEILTKSLLFDKIFLMNDFKRQYKKYVKTGTDSEINKAVRSFINRNMEMVIWNKN